MGECGCGEFQPDFKFEGPGDNTYVFQAYPSCDYCNTPAGIILYRMDPKDCKLWGVEHLPEVKIKDIGTCIGVVDPMTLREKLIGNGYEIGEFEREFMDAFLEAVHKEIGDIRKNLINDQ